MVSRLVYSCKGPKGIFWIHPANFSVNVYFIHPSQKSIKYCKHNPRVCVSRGGSRCDVASQRRLRFTRAQHTALPVQKASRVGQGCRAPWSRHQNLTFSRLRAKLPTLLQLEANSKFGGGQWTRPKALLWIHRCQFHTRLLRDFYQCTLF